MTDQLLFAYGTLKRGARGEVHRLLAGTTEFLDTGTVQAKLYSIGQYPGLVPSQDSGDRAHGEVYRLLDPDRVLSRLDEFEECGPGFSEPTEYVRLKESVRLGSGGLVSAWVYVYNRPVENLVPITSGDFAATAPQ